MFAKKEALCIVHIIVVAGAESAIGLGILVAFYRLNSSFKPYPYFITASAAPAVLSCAAGALYKNIYLYPAKSARFYSIHVREMRKNNNIIRTNKLDSSFIRGLIDAVPSGSGCFVVTILKNTRYKLG